MFSAVRESLIERVIFNPLYFNFDENKFFISFLFFSINHQSINHNEARGERTFVNQMNLNRKRRLSRASLRGLTRIPAAKALSFYAPSPCVSSRRKMDG